MKNKSQLALTIGLLVFLITSIGCSEVTEPTATRQDNSPVTIQVDPALIEKDADSPWPYAKEFLGRSMFGKPIIDWNEQDFQLIEQKLKEIIEKELPMNSRIEEEVFEYNRKENLKEKIRLIPEIKLWVAEVRARNQATAKAQAISEQEHEQRAKSDRNEMIIAIFLLLCAVTFGIHFFRARCPSCKSTKFEYLVNREREIDRWVGTKKVYTGSGDNRREENVTATWVKVECFLRCKDCNHEWCKIVERTL